MLYCSAVPQKLVPPLILSVPQKLCSPLLQKVLRSTTTPILQLNYDVNRTVRHTILTYKPSISFRYQKDNDKNHQIPSSSACRGCLWAFLTYSPYERQSPWPRQSLKERTPYFYSNNACWVAIDWFKIVPRLMKSRHWPSKCNILLDLSLHSLPLEEGLAIVLQYRVPAGSPGTLSNKLCASYKAASRLLGHTTNSG